MRALKGKITPLMSKLRGRENVGVGRDADSYLPNCMLASVPCRIAASRTECDAGHKMRPHWREPRKPGPLPLAPTFTGPTTACDSYGDGAWRLPVSMASNQVRAMQHFRTANCRVLTFRSNQFRSDLPQMQRAIASRASRASTGNASARSLAWAEAAVPLRYRPLIPWKIAASRKKLNAM